MYRDEEGSTLAGRTMELICGTGKPGGVILDVAAAHHGTGEDIRRRLIKEGHICEEDLRDMSEIRRSYASSFQQPTGLPERNIGQLERPTDRRR